MIKKKQTNKQKLTAKKKKKATKFRKNFITVDSIDMAKALFRNVSWVNIITAGIL